MSKASVHLDTNRVIGQISPLLFSGFAEHMGRCIYEGIYEPASPHADENGLRKDVLEALREINFRTIRYPGGNFVSGYRWEDGIGPKSERPNRRELAWKSIESNQFGTNEFMDFCKQVGAAPMMAANLGTGSIQDAANLVEYCNSTSGSHYADLRIKHGYKDPHNVRYWCLGNEMDGPWQIGHLEANEYGMKAKEAAKLMRTIDPDLELILCGSSSTGMPTYPEWDRIALEHTWEQVNYLSLHYYADNKTNDTPSFLAMTAQFESQLETLAGTLRYVKSKLRSKHDVYLSWDEWNVWYKNMEMDGGWTHAPRLIEEVYNLEDALVVAQWLSVFLRKCDVLKVACIAQIVNVIAPILTTTDGMLKQSIFYPLEQFSRHASGNSLDALVKVAGYETERFGEMPLLDVSASYDEASDAQGQARGAAFLVNRSLDQALEVEINWQGVAPTQVTGAWQMSGNDPKAANSFENPNQVVSSPISGVTVKDGRITLTVPPLSFTTITVAH
jgi:alpha-L-arabinofuranosidase